MNIQDAKLYVKYPPKTYEIDWEDNKQQGKRIGKMVIGSMSNAPNGKKMYIDLLGNIPEKETNPDDFIGLTTLDKINYLKAREYGLKHEDALLYMDSVHIN